MKKDLLAVSDCDAAFIRKLFQETKRLKRARGGSSPLSGKILGLLFEKPSIRTKVSFEVAMIQLGGSAVYLGPLECSQGKRESPADLGRVLSRYVDGIAARTFGHEGVEALARAAGVPVINALSDCHHPCQALSDLFTMEEKLRKLSGVRLAFVGDGNNVCHSVLEACALLGVDCAVATPKGYEPCSEIVSWAQKKARESGAEVLLTRDPREAVGGAHVVYTDVWASMGQEKEKAKRERVFRPYRVNSKLMAHARSGALFMHCLPAHRGEEVTDEVIDGPSSIVYDQAENRLHLQKAILIFLLAGSGKRHR